MHASRLLRGRRAASLVLMANAFVAPTVAQVTWTQLTTNPGPGPHSGHAWDSLRGKLVVFGGLLGGNEVGLTREWNGITWQPITPLVAPAARSRPAMAFDAARGVTVVHGGGTSFYDDTWTWNGTAWFQRTPAHVPPARFAAAMCYDAARRYVVLFGGFDAAGNDLADVWEWDGNDWAQRTWSGPGPMARGAHRMVFDAARANVLMCGGFSTPGQTSLADTWQWNGIAWSPAAPLPGSVCDQALVYDPARGRVVLAGGIRIQGSVLTDLNQTLEWSGTWQLRTTTSSLPVRNGATVGFDTGLGKIVCSGGTNSTGTELHDTWAYAPTSPAMAANYGSPCTGSPGPLKLTPVTLPYVGLAFQLQVSQASASAALGLVLLGTSSSSWLGVPLPVDLTSIGAPGCQLFASLDMLEIVALSTGSGAMSWTLPVLPTAIGAQLFAQGATLNPGAASPIDMSAAVAFLIGSP